MAETAVLERIADRAALERHLDALMGLEPRLADMRVIAGEVPLRQSEEGFAGMVPIVVGQLLSVQSAAAITARLTTFLGEVSAERFLTVDMEEIRACGLTRGKCLALRAVAEAELGGALDFKALARLPVEAAMARLVKLKGIGKWSAEIYLLFSARHADVFPAGDLALQKMVGHVLEHDMRPDEKSTRQAVEHWAPHRGAAALLLWAGFRALKKREGIVL